MHVKASFTFQLFRNHIWRYGLVYRDGEVEEELNISHFEEAFKHDDVTGELKLLFKFGLSHLRAKKNELQRVYLAVQSLNDSMSCKFKILTWPELEAQHVLQAHPGNCICIEFSRCGRYFATGSGAPPCRHHLSTDPKQ